MSADFDLDTRRKRIRYRAWHRGLRELELIMGRFADAHGADLDATGVAEFERLLDAEDGNVLAWLMGQQKPDAGCDNGVFRRLKAFADGIAA